MNELILDLQQSASQYSLRFLDEIFPVAQHIIEIGKTQSENLALLKNDYPDAIVGQIDASDIHRLKQGVVDLVIADLFTLQRTQAESNLQKIKASLTDNSLLILPVLSHRVTDEVSENDVFLDNEELKPLLSGLKPLFIVCNEVPVKINNERVTLFVYYLSTNKLFEDRIQLIKKIKLDAQNALSDKPAVVGSFDEAADKEEPAEKESNEDEAAELPESEGFEARENATESELSEPDIEKEGSADQEQIESEAKEALEQEPREDEPVEHEDEIDEDDEEQEEAAESEIESESEVESAHHHTHYHAHIHEEHDVEHIEEHGEDENEEDHQHPHLHQAHKRDHANVAHEQHEQHESHSHEHDHDHGENKSIHHELARHAKTMQAHHDSIRNLEATLNAHHENTSSMLKLFSQLEKPEEKHALIKKLAAAHAEHSALLGQYKALHEAHREAYKNFMAVYEKGLEDAVSFGDKFPELVPTHQMRLQKQQELIESHEALLHQSSQFIPRPS